MANDNRLEIRISGENVSPALVRVKELAEILKSVEDMLSATMIQKFPDLAKGEIVIGLVDVKPGSARYQFQSQLPEPAEIAFATITSAISESNYLSLPGTTIKALGEISAFTKRHFVNAEFRQIDGSDKLLAVITPETEIPLIPTIIGETNLLCKIVRVGGREPRAMVETPNGEIVYCDLNEKLARELSPYLYSWVVLEGTAKWNTKDYSLQGFRVLRITPYKGDTFNQGLKDIYNLVSRYLNEINDVQQFVRELRDF